MKVTGRCHCGAIAYEAEVEPNSATICHCTDYQRLTGTAYRVTIDSLPGTFVLKRGAPRTYLKTAESGAKIVHGFCADCCTPLYSALPETTPESYGLRLGAIDQGADLGSPRCQLWCRSAMPWSTDISGVPRIERE